MTSLSEYSVAIVKLRRGIFDQELIEEKEQAIEIIGVQWEHDTELYKAWWRFLQSGIFLRDLAEDVTNDGELRQLWTAPRNNDKPPGQDFGELQRKANPAQLRQLWTAPRNNDILPGKNFWELQRKVIEALCTERKNILKSP